MPRKLTKEDVAKRIATKWPDWNFEVLLYNNTIAPCVIKCLDCGVEKEYQQLYHLLNKQTPCICTSNSSQFKSKQQIAELNTFFKNSDEFFLVYISIH